MLRDAVEGPEIEILREIVGLVGEALGRFGTAGEVRLEGDHIVLLGAGPPASVEVGSLPTQWELLPPDVRSRRATDLARRLVTQRRGGSLHPAPARSSVALPAWVKPAGVVLLGAVVLVAIYRFIALQPSEQAPAGTGAAPTAAQHERERASRAARVCESTRARVMLGATVSPTDVEGWVVEITLLRPGATTDLSFDPALSAFVDRRPGETRGRFVWPSAKEIVQIEGPDTVVIVSDASLLDSRHPRLRGVKLTFTGRYVVPYFRDEDRILYVRLAAALAERLGATHGAAAARCAHAHSYQLGSWFLGDTPASAAATLMLFMGAFADAPQLRATLLTPPDAGDGLDTAYAFDQLVAATKGLERGRISTVIGKHGGMIAGKPDASSSITFPFKDGNRAGRASRDIALELGIGVER